MHAYFMTRGIKQDVDLFVKFLETRFMPFKVIDKDGNERYTNVQGALRPIQLWEYVFPQECMPEVLTALDFDKQIFPNTFKMKAAVAGLRKMLGAEKIPKFDTSKSMILPKTPWVSIVPIGIKKDITREFTEDGHTHEAL